MPETKADVARDGAPGLGTMVGSLTDKPLTKPLREYSVTRYSPMSFAVPYAPSGVHAVDGSTGSGSWPPYVATLEVKTNRTGPPWLLRVCRAFSSRARVLSKLIFMPRSQFSVEESVSLISRGVPVSSVQQLLLTFTAKAHDPMHAVDDIGLTELGREELIKGLFIRQVGLERDGLVLEACRSFRLDNVSKDTMRAMESCVSQSSCKSQSDYE